MKNFSLQMPRKYTRKDGAKPRVAIPPDILKAAVDKTIPLIKARLLNHKICVFISVPMSLLSYMRGGSCLPK